MTSKEVREKLGPLVQEIKAMADLIAKEQRTFSAEEQGKFDKLNSDYNSLKAQYDALAVADRAAAFDAEARDNAKRAGAADYEGRREGERHDPQRQEPITAETRNLALSGWVAAQRGRDLSTEQRDACKRLGLNPATQELEIRLLPSREFRLAREARALSAVSNTAGGYTVPDDMVRSLERAMLYYGPMRQVATVIRTSGVGDLSMPTSDDTSNKGAILGESTAVSEQDVSFGAIVMRAHKYTSKLVKVPTELLEDSAFDVAAILGDALGERIGRILNDHFTTGTGTNEPRGIVTATSAGKTTNSGTAITLGELIDLQHSVDIAYRQGAGVGWMMHDNIVAYLRKIQDSASGQLIWQPSLQAGVPDRLLGFPVYVNNSMASSVATTLKTILFGDLSKYLIRDVGSLRLRRLVERYADSDQEGFVAFSRHDGNLLNAGVAPVKHMLQA